MDMLSGYQAPPSTCICLRVSSMACTVATSSLLAHSMSTSSLARGSDHSYYTHKLGRRNSREAGIIGVHDLRIHVHHGGELVCRRNGIVKVLQVYPVAANFRFNGKALRSPRARARSSPPEARSQRAVPSLREPRRAAGGVGVASGVGTGVGAGVGVTAGVGLASGVAEGLGSTVSSGSGVGVEVGATVLAMSPISSAGALGSSASLPQAARQSSMTAMRRREVILLDILSLSFSGYDLSKRLYHK